MREHTGQAAQLAALVLRSRAEPARIRGAEVRHQKAAGRVAGALQEGTHGRHDVPCAGGQVHDGGVGALGHALRRGRRGRQRCQQVRHAGDGLARGHSVQEGMSRGRDQARQHRHHDGVVDVGDHAEVLVVGHDAHAHACGASRADAALAWAFVHRRGRGGQRRRGAQGGGELGGRLLGHAERAHVARVQDLDGRVVPARLEAVAQDRDVDKAAAIREGESACVSDSDEHGLTGDLRVEELAPAAPRLQPGTAVVAARHEDAAEDAGAALRSDAAESDHARVVPALRHGGDQQRRREFAHAGRDGERERR